MDVPAINGLSIDKSFYIRVLEEDKYLESKKLQEQSKEFTEKTDRFISILSSFSQIMEGKQKTIDEAKLRAIGFRNQVESEIELRRRKQFELEALIEEKQNEVDRYTKQLDSLERMEHEQKLLLERLMNNEM